MTDFGRRALRDEEFNELYKNEMDKFKERVLTGDTFGEKYGSVGNVYGKQCRDWIGPDGQSVDQLENVIVVIKTVRDWQRHIDIDWDRSANYKMALPPC